MVFSEIRITKQEKKKYVLARKKDREILVYCKKLEKMKLSKNNKDIVKLIKTQLKRNWRSPLLKELKRIHKKYS